MDKYLLLLHRDLYEVKISRALTKVPQNFDKYLIEANESDKISFSKGLNI